MERTESYVRVFPGSILNRFDLVEVRNAAAALHGTNPTEFNGLAQILDGFYLTLASLTEAGKNKGWVAQTLDAEFRKRGWREGGYESETVFSLRLEPYPKGTQPEIRLVRFHSRGHKVDNVLGRVALDVEWNAKDGNLDRDLANFRTMHDAGVIDVGIIITRHHERTKYAANHLAELAGLVRTNPKGERIVLLGTSTTTTLEKLTPRLLGGNAGGCPVLGIAITERCYKPGPGDPSLPPFHGPVHPAGIAESPDDDEADLDD